MIDDEDIAPQITLIGMSNIGKSHWADRLVKSGYKKIGCDVAIEKALSPELTKLGFSGIQGMAKWMGQPYEQHYQQNSRKYIEIERAVMRAAIEELLFDEEDTSFVIDTTGSVIYTGDEIIKELRELTLVVYLEESPDDAGQLFDRYVQEPKPVIWGTSFQARGSEPPMDAVKRCYPDLLASRAKQYRKMAHVILPYEQHKKANGDLMALIEKQKAR